MDELLKWLRELAWNQYATISQCVELMQQIVNAKRKAVVDEAERIATESVNSTE
jgi:hypothetical protein